MIPDNTFQALSLDLSVLEGLLKRHRTNHGRTLYFRRISMALKAIQRHNLVDFCSQMESLERDVNQWSQQRKRKKRRNEEEHWDLTQRSNSGRDEVLESLKVEASKVQKLLVHQFPEFLSRIQLASSALFMEINRGFFLPFCTVALSALARVRVLILQIGRLGLTQLKELLLQSSDSSSMGLIELLPNETYEKAISNFLVDDTLSDENDEDDTQNQNQMLASLGLTVRLPGEAKVDSSIGKGDNEPSSSNEDAKESRNVARRKIDDLEDDFQEGASTKLATLPTTKDSKNDDVGESMTFFSSSASKDTSSRSHHNKSPPFI